MATVVYLLIDGYCEYDAHEGMIGVYASVDAAKEEAAAKMEERWDLLDRFRSEQRREKVGRFTLRWNGNDDKGWSAATGSGGELRIEPADVKGAP